MSPKMVQTHRKASGEIEEQPVSTDVNIRVQETQRAVWKFTELSLHCDKHGVGSLRGRFEVSNGPSSLATIAAQFNCEGATLSGIEFQLIGHGYRLSLVKKRFVSGKYICDGGDADSKFRYASTATVES